MTAKAALVISRLSALVVVTAISAVSYAQTYPTKSIRIVNPFSPGGSLDLVARALARTMTAELGQPVYVVNRPGAGGNQESCPGRRCYRTCSELP